MDTHLQRRDTSGYQVVEGLGVRVLVSPLLAQQAQRIHLDLQRFLFWKNLSVYAET